VDRSDPTSQFSELNEEQLGTFLADIAHKMKNKLGGIHGFASLLEKDLPEEDSKLRLAQKVQDGILQLNTILIQFMKIFQQVDPQQKTIDLPRFLQDCILQANKENALLFLAGAPPLSSSEASFMESVDPDCLREVIVQAMVFVASISGKIERIHFSMSGADTVQIGLDYILPKDTHTKNRSTQVAELILNAQPFESRLALAVAAKYCRTLKGNLEIRSPSNSRRMLLIQLKRGQ
jgi:hypothetical protein